MEDVAVGKRAAENDGRRILTFGAGDEGRKPVYSIGDQSVGRAYRIADETD